MRPPSGPSEARSDRRRIGPRWAREIGAPMGFAFALNSSLDCGVQFPGRAACAIGAGVGTGVGVGVGVRWGMRF